VTTALAKLPELPAHHHPIKQLPEAERLALLEAVLSHYENGAEIAQLAEQLGVSDITLYRNIKRYKSEEWREITSARYESEIDQAQREMKSATDANVVTRARERLRIASWVLERLDRKNYGQDVAQAGAAVQVNINLRRQETPLDVVVIDQTRAE
jgi:IS30 family transposase